MQIYSLLGDGKNQKITHLLYRTGSIEKVVEVAETHRVLLQEDLDNEFEREYELARARVRTYAKSTLIAVARNFHIALFVLGILIMRFSKTSFSSLNQPDLYSNMVVYSELYGHQLYANASLLSAVW